MDHTEAIRLQAAEKYVLRELSPTLMEEYEEHFFDCAECALDIKAATAFVDASREVFRQQPEQEIASQSSPSSSGWFAWLKPAFAIPVFAALLLFIGYQNVVTIPALQHSSSLLTSAEIVKSFPLKSVRGGNDVASPTIRVLPNEEFELDVDMPGNSPEGYTCQVQDQSGHVQFTLKVSSEEAKNTVHVRVLGGTLRSGTYKFVIFNGQTPAATSDYTPAPFVVEFVR
jgi:hypothetical protein